MAGAVLGSVPIVLIYVVFMDYYVSGLTSGGDGSEMRVEVQEGTVVWPV